MEEAEDAVSNWLGEEFPDEEVLVLLQVNLPEGWELEKDPELDLSASKSLKRIPSKYISVINDNF